MTKRKINRATGEQLTYLRNSQAQKKKGTQCHVQEKSYFSKDSAIFIHLLNPFINAEAIPFLKKIGNTSTLMIRSHILIFSSGRCAVKWQIFHVEKQQL